MRMLASCLAALALAGCASLESVPEPKAGMEGLTYYMPKKDFVLTVTYADGKMAKATLTESAAYPDFAHAYLLRYSRNLFGKNAMNLGANEKGLLTSASSNTTSGVSDALKGLASTAGTFSALHMNTMGAPATSETKPACGNGDNVLVVPAVESSGTDDDHTLCGFHVKVEKIGKALGIAVAAAAYLAKAANDPSASSEGAGIYYRQTEPYRVTARSESATVEAILFSPSDAPIRYLPVYRSVFANNTATFAFNDGMPTGYTVDTDGEVIALLKLPADIVSAYFAAVGAVFDSFKAADTNRAAAMDAELKLQVERQKYYACLAAINSGNLDALLKLGC